MTPIAPITPSQQQQVLVATNACIVRAGELLQRSFKIIPVAFDLRGRAAGMYRVQGKQRWIRYNPYLFAKYFDENLTDTVPHEVAHYLIDMLYGLRKVRAHGPEWRELAHMLGASTKATCRFDLTGVPVRTQQRFAYRCDCTTHALTTRRHNQARHGHMRYFCRTCRGELRYEAEECR
jgi:SprT protein